MNAGGIIFLFQTSILTAYFSRHFSTLTFCCGLRLKDDIYLTINLLVFLILVGLYYFLFVCCCFSGHLFRNVIIILSKELFIVSFDVLCCLFRGILSDCDAWYVAFSRILCGPCMRIVHFEYTVSDLNYADIISIIKAIHLKSVGLTHQNIN